MSGVLDRHRDVGEAGLTDRLPSVEGLQGRDLVRVLLQQSRKVLEDLPSPRGAHPWPGALVEGIPRHVDGRLCILAGRPRDGRDDLCG